MIYFDTAYLAKCYLNENGRPQVRELAPKSRRISCCAFGRLERTATIHQNLHEGEISLQQSKIIFN